MILLNATDDDGEVIFPVESIAMIYEKYGRNGKRCRLVELKNDAGDWEVIESSRKIFRLIRQAKRRQKRWWF